MPPTSTESAAPPDEGGAAAVPGPAVEPESKGERTRQRILDTALRLFEERGYDQTTMRAVATEAGVSLGNAYYYFRSKDHLVQGFYDRMQVTHRAAAAAALADERDATQRLRIAAHAWLDTAAPYHRFAGAFFRVAAEPTSPLSPFSTASTAARRAAIGLYADVVRESDLRVARDLADRLPELLWLAQMGLVLFWVHDSSPRQQRSRALVDRAAPMLVRALRLTRLAPLRAVTNDFVALLESLGVGGATTGATAERAHS